MKSPASGAGPEAISLEYLPPAHAIFLTGFMGTGKTTNGKRLAERLNLPFVDTDAVVECISGKTIPELFKTDGEAAFRDLETEALRRVIAGPTAVVSTGGGIMLRPENVELMRAAGPIVCLHASPQTIYQRTGHRDDRPLLQTPDPLATIKALLAERREAYARADYHITTDQPGHDYALPDILRVLSRDPRAALLVSDSARLTVRADRSQYRVHIAPGAFEALGQLCPPPAPAARCAVITTDVIAPLYGSQVLAALRSGGWEPQLLVVPDGEGSKTLQTAAGLYDRLVDSGVDTGGAVFALGGGMVGDLAGFVAATYRRGVKLAQLPTSLLAQVDASIGGKVAVDHPRGKNLVGTFYQPSAVVIDTKTLVTLPERELRAGLAEVIKHAAIADARMFEYLENHLDDLLNLDDLATRYLLVRNIQIKAHIIEKDPYDRGLRACLNYGHTIGHAIERAAADWGLRHGEAVAIGIAAEAHLALAMGLCDQQTVQRQVALLRRAGLLAQTATLDCNLAEQALSQDKKIAAGRLRLPVVPEIGRVTILTDVEPAALRDALCTALGDAERERGGLQCSA